MLNKKQEQPTDDIFKNRFSETKDTFERKMKKMTSSGLSLKGKRKSKKAQSQSKRRKIKDIFTGKQYWIVQNRGLTFF